MNLAAFADSEEDISIQLPFARLQLLCMPSLVSCKKEQIVFWNTLCGCEGGFIIHALGSFLGGGGNMVSANSFL